MDLDTIFGSIYGYDEPYESQPHLSPENAPALADVLEEQNEQK